MKPEGSFVAERVAAQHCQELLRSPKPAVDPVEALAPFGARLAELLETRLPALFAGARPKATAGEAAKIQPGTPEDKQSKALVSSLLAVGPRELGMATSLSQRAVLSIVDFVFGGSGAEQEGQPAKLPLSARLTYQRFEKLLAEAIAAALDMTEDGAVKIKQAASGIDADVPFSSCTRIVLPLEITLEEAEPWDLQLIFPPVTLQVLFAGKAPARAAAPAAPITAATLPENMADIPLPLTALLVDMDVPVALLSQLQPGMVLPVSVARNVPLYAGERIIAHGHVGEADDRTALKITRTQFCKEN